MFAPLCVLTILISATPAELSKDYETAKANAANRPDGLVRLALWCESHGLTRERARNLALAVITHPEDARARALLGMVKVGGHWRDAAAAGSQPAPEILVRYNGRRAVTDVNRADSQYDLALWCERNGLKAEARAHFGAVVRLDPSRETAWHHMGFRRHRGRWMTAEQVAAESAGAKARHDADKRWGPKLDRLRTLLRRGGDGAAEAEAALAGVHDPLAAPKVWEIFVVKSSRADDHERAARLLAGIESDESTRWLARLAVSDPHDAVREAAGKTLAERDPRIAISALVDMLRAPVAFLVVPHYGEVVGELQVEGKAFNLDRFYVLREEYNPLFELNREAPVRAVTANRAVRVTETFTPARAVFDYRAATAEASMALRRDAQMVRAFNVSIVAMNQRIEELLGTLTRFDVDADETLREELRRISADQALARDRMAAAENEVGQRRRQIASEAAMIDLAIEAQAAALRRQLLVFNRAIRGTTDSKDVVKTRARGSQIAQRANLGARNVGQARSVPLGAEGMQAQIEAERAAWEEARVASKRVEARNGAWRRWWADERGYSFKPSEPVAPRYKPTIVQVRTFDVPVVVLPPEYSVSVYSMSVTRVHSSCFAAGTLVHTQTGRRPIEEIQVGDLVLSQDTASGALAYRAVTTVHHRKPSPTLRLAFGGEELVATGIHRFWKAGQGWVMARDLKAGDVVRTTHGVLTVESVSAGETRQVYNLEVDGARDFFVGSAGALVHDDSLPEPVSAPFDAYLAL